MKPDNDMKNQKITLHPKTAELILKEMESIPEKYWKPFNSTHEGYAVLLEEVRELEHVVFFGEKEAKQESAHIGMTTSAGELELKERAKRIHKDRLREEAVQIAAMACRIIQELT